MSLFRFVQRISEGRPVTVYGDGRQSRDFTYNDRPMASGQEFLQLWPLPTGKMRPRATEITFYALC